MKRLILVCLLVCNSYAEPTPSVQWLMNEPVTLWDWGVVRLEQHLMKQIHEWSDGEADVVVVNDTKEGRLIIGIWPVTGVSAKDEAEAREMCKKAIGFVRLTVGVSKRFLGNDSIIASFFRHRGFRGSNEPTDLQSQIATMIEIDVKWRYPHPYPDQEVRCKAPLVYSQPGVFADIRWIDPIGSF